MEVSGADGPMPAFWQADVELLAEAEDGAIASVNGRAILHLQGDAPTLELAKLAAMVAVIRADETVEYDSTPPARSTYASRMQG